MSESCGVKITLASAMGTCFGVQDAIDMALDPAFAGRLTVVGQLVHNPQTVDQLRANGIRIVERDEIDSITTEAVMVTAHGAADSTKADLQARGFTVYDATCPLVIRLHKLARWLERKGYFVVIVGQRDHVEIKGVVGNLQNCLVVAGVDEIGPVAGNRKVGVVSQTTNRLERVWEVVAAIEQLDGIEEVRFTDTICQPVKDRQAAIQDLLSNDIDLGIVVGGFNSSNTRKLLDLLHDRGVDAHHIERPEELEAEWFTGRNHVGITAGTSTPQDVIEEVHQAVRRLVCL
ncbi:MAG: 4-hydroxy-3-methylbut-2-enyl diphosphate reductase [Planctomycetota bacterium]|jgi:4-hydroxy-3-methylbut-2-enyl diphosphate reductase|nr:4-hydroxy-3-methylbut-2-enyl diphosphate reductase [Planctomycetota bacterium]